MPDRIGDISPGGTGGGGIEGLINLLINLLILAVVVYAGYQILMTLLTTL